MKKTRASLLLLAALLGARASRAQVGIGTTTPDAKAALDIRATDKGLLIPRLTVGQRTAITAPPQGLMVYQTDGTAGGGTQTGFWYYIGTSWVYLDPAVPAATLALPYSGTASTSSPAFAITNTGAGQALSGSNAAGTITLPAVLGQNTNTTSGLSTGVLGTTVGGFGVRGTASGSGGYGVAGQATDSYGVVGLSTSGVGVYGNSRTGVSVQGLKFSGDLGRAGEFLNSDAANDSTVLYVSTPGDRPAIRAVNTAASDQAAIRGVKQAGSGGIGLEGIAGSSTTGSATGVLGRDLSGTTTGSGVVGRTTAGYGVQGVATTGYGVSASATSGTALVATSSSGLAIDAVSGAIRTTRLQSPSTGTTNLLPICYGNVSGSGTINTAGSASNFTVSRLGAGVYDITITGESYLYTSYTTVASLNTGGGTGGEISTISSGGRLRVYTFTSAGALADRDFCFVTYQP